MALRVLKSAMYEYLWNCIQGQRPPRKGQHKRIRKLTEPAAGRHNISAEDIREELFGKDEDDNGECPVCLPDRVCLWQV